MSVETLHSRNQINKRFYAQFNLIRFLVIILSCGGGNQKSSSGSELHFVQL